MQNDFLFKNELLKIGVIAKELLMNEEKAPIVHSVFDNAINLLCSEDYLVTILPEHKECFTQAIVVSSAAFYRIKLLGLIQGVELSVGLKEIIRNTEAYELGIPSELVMVDREQLKHNISCGLDELRKDTKASIMVCFILDMETDFSNMLRSKLYGLEECLTSNDTYGMFDKLEGLIGFGHGLTPSGDDFIYGFLAALFYSYTLKGIDNYLLYQLAEKLSDAAKAHTTIISYNMLRSCIYGDFNESVRQMAINLVSSTDIKSSLHDLLKIGSTSGADIAAGMLYGYKTMLDFK